VDELLSESVGGVSVPGTKGVDKVEGGVGLGLSLTLAQEHMAGSAGDGLVGGVDAGSRLAIDKGDAITITQPGLSLGIALGKELFRDGGVGLGLSLTLAQEHMAGSAGDGLVGGVDAGGGLAVDKGDAITITQPGLSLGVALAKEHMAGSAGDGLVGGIDAWGRLAIDNGETGITITQPGFGSSGSDSSEHSNEGLHVYRSCV